MTPRMLRLTRHRQDNGAAVCVPRLAYYLARGQRPQERVQTVRLLCQEWAWVRAQGWTGADLQVGLN